MKGPAIFLAQFAGTEAPFDRLDTLAQWASGLGCVGVQVPTNDPALFDLALAASSQTYCDEIAGKLSDVDITISELSTHLQGQLVAVHPAYAPQFAAFAPPALRDKPNAWCAWATEQLRHAAKASAAEAGRARDVLGRAAVAHRVPVAAAAGGPRRRGLRRARAPLAADPRCIRRCRGRRLLRDPSRRGPARWCDVRTLPRRPRRPHALQHPVRPEPFSVAAARLCGLHRPVPRAHQGVSREGCRVPSRRPLRRVRGYRDWIDRPGRFRSPGDGQIDFTRIFSKLAQYDYRGWAVLEWECALKHPEDGARERAPFIRQHMIRTTTKRFDDFAATRSDADSRAGLTRRGFREDRH